MHECPICGQACDCDGEDTWLDAPDDCVCELSDCEREDFDDEDDFEREDCDDLDHDD